MLRSRQVVSEKMRLDVLVGDKEVEVPVVVIVEHHGTTTVTRTVHAQVYCTLRKRKEAVVAPKANRLIAGEGAIYFRPQTNGRRPNDLAGDRGRLRDQP